MAVKPHAKTLPAFQRVLKTPFMREIIRSRDIYEVEERLPDSFEDLLRRLDEKERSET